MSTVDTDAWRANLRVLIEVHRWPLSQISREAGLSDQHLGKLLRGRQQPGVDTIQRVLTVVGRRLGRPLALDDLVTDLSADLLAPAPPPLAPVRPAPGLRTTEAPHYTVGLTAGLPPDAADIIADGGLGARDLPVYASARGGNAELMLTYEPIEWVRRPAALMGVAQGFAMYVIGESMAPRYRHGEMVLIHPRRPARGGDDVLVVLRHHQDQDHQVACAIKHLVSASDTEVRLTQHNPPAPLTLTRAEVDGLYPIVGMYTAR